jgi:serine protease inhibitor
MFLANEPSKLHPELKTIHALDIKTNEPLYIRFMQKTLNLLFIFSVLLFTHCSGIKQESTPNPGVQMSGDFDFDLFRTEAALNDGNTIISPLSVKQVLLMVAAAASDQGLQELEQALDIEDMDQSLNANKSMLMNLKQTDSAEIGLANMVFNDPSRISLLGDFKQNAQAFFEAEIMESDFSKPQAVDELNQWVDQKTKGRIDKLLSSISPDEAVFLLNALYMKADWEKGFDAQSTRKNAFWKSNGDSVHTDIMFADRNFDYGTYKDAGMLRLPLKNNTFNCFFIQNTKGDIDELIQDMDAKYFEALETSLSSSRYMLRLPKFSLRYSNEEMKNTLEQLGIQTVFQQSGHLDHLAEEKNTMLSRVIHKTFISVDERGVEGAAVTAAGVSVTSLPPTIEFTQPFMLVIRHEASGAIFFMGRISDPSEG